MGVKLGLYISTTAIEWAIVSKDNTILDAGIRSFPKYERNERREKRLKRRMIRRRKGRIEKVKIFLKKYGLHEIEPLNNQTPYEIKVKGLNNRLNEKELAIALLHWSKRRGVKTFKNNEVLYENEFVCKIQLNKLKDSKVRGVNNLYNWNFYKKEITVVLENQKKYYEKIDNKFINEYINILENRREYHEGPSKPSPYGWSTKEEWRRKLLGHCPYFKEEVKALKHSYTSELFKLLCELNKINLRDRISKKLNTKEKEKLIEIAKKEIKGLNKDIIARTLEINQEDIEGMENYNLTPLKSYIEINKCIYKNEGFIIEDRDTIDEIVEIIALYPSKETIKEKLDEYLLGIDYSGLEDLRFHKTSPVSKKIMEIVLESLKNTSKSYIEILEEKGIKKSDNLFFENINLTYQTKRVLYQLKNILISIEKKYKEIDSINFSLEKIEKNKNYMEKIELNEKIDKKIKFLEIQRGICLYSGEKIEKEDIEKHSYKYEIDHIIPYSISRDNSFDNLVLVKREENREKGSQTPFEYLNKKGMYEEFKNRVEEYYEKQYITLEKKSNLLLETNFKYPKDKNEYFDLKIGIKQFIRYYREKGKKIRINFIENNKVSNDKIALKIVMGEKNNKKIEKFNKFKISNFIDKKINRKISDDTIYSTRKDKITSEEYIIGKLKNIYDEKNESIKEFFLNEKKQTQLLMFHNDPKTFNKFLEICKKYEKDKNPFFSYYKEHRKEITKYSKKEKGPFINEIKYRVSKLGNYLDISHKYNVKDKKVVLLGLNSYRADFYSNGEDYKFISVNHSNFKECKNFYELRKEEYSREQLEKGITTSYKFIFSLYKGDTFLIETKDTKEKLVFKSIKDSGTNRIIAEENKVITIGKKIKNLKKIVKNYLGKEYFVEESFKEIIKK